MTALGLKPKKDAKDDTKSHKAKDDADDYLKQLEKKKEESSDTCVFC